MVRYREVWWIITSFWAFTSAPRSISKRTEAAEAVHGSQCIGVSPSYTTRKNHVGQNSRREVQWVEILPRWFLSGRVRGPAAPPWCRCVPMKPLRAARWPRPMLTAAVLLVCAILVGACKYCTTHHFPDAQVGLESQQHLHQRNIAHFTGHK